MTDRTLLVALVAVVALAATPLGVAGAFVDGAPAQEDTPSPTPTPTPAASTNDSNASNASLGASVSAFMQASAAEAEGEVDRGMFAAAFNASDNETRDRLVRDRAADLETRLERLRAEREALLDDGNVTVAERAKAARLTARIDALQRAIDQTDDAAARANVSLNRTKLSELRAAAGNLSGPEVAEIATGIVDRPERGQGPPEDRGGEARGDRAAREDGAAGGNASDGSPPEGGNAADAGNTSDAAEDTDGDAAGNTSDAGDGSDADAGSADGDDPGNSERGGGADGRENGRDGVDASGRDG